MKFYLYWVFHAHTKYLINKHIYVLNKIEATLIYILLLLGAPWGAAHGPLLGKVVGPGTPAHLLNLGLWGPHGPKKPMKA